MKNSCLSSIYTYPVKSLRGISTGTSRLTGRGLLHDRRWMLVDENLKFLTQRQLSKMSLVNVSISTDSLVIDAIGMQTLTIPLEQNYKTSISVKIWNDICDASYVSDEADEWFSDFLGCKCSLVYMTDDAHRAIDGHYSINENDLVSYADGFPYLIISEASLNDLNNRLVSNGEEKVDMIRFRPNLVISGCEPYEEDNWKEIQIGSLQFNIVKPCSRCIIPTINIKTGERSAEPLRTLQSYRKKNNKIYFGQNTILSYNSLTPDAVISVGDEVIVLS